MDNIGITRYKPVVTNNVPNENTSNAIKMADNLLGANPPLPKEIINNAHDFIDAASTLEKNNEFAKAKKVYIKVLNTFHAQYENGEIDGKALALFYRLEMAAFRTSENPSGSIREEIKDEMFKKIFQHAEAFRLKTNDKIDLGTLSMINGLINHSSKEYDNGRTESLKNYLNALSHNSRDDVKFAEIAKKTLSPQSTFIKQHEIKDDYTVESQNRESIKKDTLSFRG